MKTNSMFGMAALVGLVAMAGSMDASAQSQTTRTFVTNPAGVCQGALPAFETAIRKRPLAIVNEGTSNAFVTCSFTSQGNIVGLEMWFRSTTEASSAVTCTAVSSYDTAPNNAFVTKTIELSASGEQDFLEWTPADFGGTTTFPSSLINVSCALPAGAAINDSYLGFVEVVAAPPAP